MVGRAQSLRYGREGRKGNMRAKANEAEGTSVGATANRPQLKCGGAFGRKAFALLANCK